MENQDCQGHLGEDLTLCAYDSEGAEEGGAARTSQGYPPWALFLLGTSPGHRPVTGLSVHRHAWNQQGPWQTFQVPTNQESSAGTHLWGTHLEYPCNPWEDKAGKHEWIRLGALHGWVQAHVLEEGTRSQGMKSGNTSLHLALLHLPLFSFPLIHLLPIVRVGFLCVGVGGGSGGVLIFL